MKMNKRDLKGILVFELNNINNLSNFILMSFYLTIKETLQKNMNKLKNPLQKFIRHSSRLTYRYKCLLLNFS